MENADKPKKPNALAGIMARDVASEQLSALMQKYKPNAPIPTDGQKSPALQKALERFGNAKPEPLPLPGTDWDLWSKMPKATLTEAVAVSLGLDPSAIEPRSGYAEPGKDFDRRLKLACAHVSHAGPIKSLDTLPPAHLFHGPATATVSLPQFAEWALSMGWELPEKFPRLKAAPRQPATNSTAPATQNPLHVAIQQIVKTELQKHKPAPVATTEPPAPPVAAVGASGSMNWTLNKPQRFQGYSKPLYDLLKAAHIAGQPCPKARDVLDKWKENPPLDVATVTDNGLKYYDAQGNTKPADLEAIRKAIDRMIR